MTVLLRRYLALFCVVGVSSCFLILSYLSVMWKKMLMLLLLFSSRWDFLLRMCISSSAVISFKRNCNQIPFQISRHLHVWCGKLYDLRLCVPASVCVPPVFELFISCHLLRLYPVLYGLVFWGWWGNLGPVNGAVTWTIGPLLSYVGLHGFSSITNINTSFYVMY